MKHKHSVAVLSFLMFITACSINKNKTPLNAPPVSDLELSSQIVINYRLEKKTLQDTFNTGIDEALSEEFFIPEYDLIMKLSKPDIAQVEIEGKKNLVVVPVKVWLEKKTFLTTVKAKGTLEMTFLSQFDIDSLWQLRTDTDLSFHRWIEKPKLDIAGIHIPITLISDSVLKRSKSLIENTIDNAIRDNFLLKDKMGELLSVFHQPQQFSPTLRAWLQFKPQKFELSPVVNSQYTARGKIHIQGTTLFTTYKPEQKGGKPILPRVFWNESIQDSSVIRIVSDIKTYDINSMLKENIEGKTFASDGKSITLSDMVTNCDYQNLRITASVQGSFNGKMYITAFPQYDKNAHRFQIKIGDIKFKTKNIFHSAAAWIGQSKIKNEFEKKLVFQIDEQVNDVQKAINSYTEALRENYDMDLNIRLGSIEIDKFTLYPGQIEAVLVARAHIDAHIKDLRKLSQIGF